MIQTKAWAFQENVPVLSGQFSRSVVSDSLRPHEPQHARPPCPSPAAGVYSNSRPLSRWRHPTISSWVIPLSSCPQSFPTSALFKWVSSSHQVAKVLEFQLQHLGFIIWPVQCSAANTIDWIYIDPMDCSPPGSSVHGVLQARILEWVAMPSFRGSSQPRGRTQVSHNASGFFTVWDTREAYIDQTYIQCRVTDTLYI